MNCSYCCHSLIFFWRVSFHWFPFVSCLHVLSQASFRYISHFFVLYNLLLHLSCMFFDMDPFPQGGFYWIKVNSCQVTSAIRERKWWAVNHYAYLHIICFCQFWIRDVAKHYWWAFWIISPLKATYKATFNRFWHNFSYTYLYIFKKKKSVMLWMYLSALLNEQVIFHLFLFLRFRFFFVFSFF